MRRAHLVLMALLFLPWVAPARAGMRPFHTETADLLPDGAVEVDAGIQWARDTRRVLFPEAEGDDLRFPVLGLRTGLGSWAELRVEGDLYRRFDPDDGSAVDGAGDWQVATKVRFGPPGRRQAWAAWLSAKIPVASDEEGLGTDEIDLEARLLWRLTAGRAKLDLNGGVALLGAPFRQRSQADLATYSALYRFAVNERLELGVEFAGRQGHEVFGALGIVRAGASYRLGRWRLDGALGGGFTESSPSLELRIGATFRFQRGPGQS